MKNRILKVSLLSIFGLMLSIGAFAQETGRVWSLGPEIGAAFSNHGKDADDSEYKSGLVAGGFVTYSIQDTYAFTTKILFNQKGAKSEDGETKERLNYIEVPVLARVFFNREGTVRPNVFFGPSFGFLTGAQWKLGDDDYKNVEDIEDFDPFTDVDSYKDVYNTFDFGVSLGLGLSIRVADEMYFIIDTRYTYGLSEVYKNADGSSNNQNATVTAGLSFGIGK
jgi:hypothetical protein